MSEWQPFPPDGYAGYFLGRGYFSDSIGIGTDQPATELDVYGSISISGVVVPSGRVAVASIRRASVCACGCTARSSTSTGSV